MKIAFSTLGCKLNYAETSTYERGFLEAGWEVVPWKEKADVYLVNTCSVTEMAEKKSRNLIRRAHKTAPEARIVVTGCYAQLRREKLLSIDGVWKVFGADEKNTLVKSVLEGVPSENVASRPLPSSMGPSLLSGRGWPEFSEGTPSKTSNTSTFGAYSSGEERTRSFLKVQDGCDNFCRYCTVPYARGRSRSVRICEAVKAAEAIAAEGVKEVVITGVNTGDFGKNTGESFLDLLKALNGVEGIARWRISSIEPNLITEEIIDWIASGTKFQPHFHIPLQQGTDTILSAMGRKYTTAFFADRIAYIRSRMEGPGKPKVFFGIDVMAGLPGESEELFGQELNFLERIRPAFIHVFPYSKRPGTPAAVMPDQVSEQIKAQRVARLEELCEKLHSEFVEANRGIKEKVLFESKEKDGSMSGYTGNYIRITRPYDKDLVGKLTEVII